MPALTVPSPVKDSSSSTTHTPSLSIATGDGQKRQDGATEESQSVDLEKPPESPLTPTASFAELAKVHQPKAQRKPKATATFPAPDPNLIDHPQPIPISQESEPDVLAMRSAISILQIQREKAIRDIQTLEKGRRAAVANPEAFVEELKSGRLKSNYPKNDYLGPTLANDSSGEDDDDDTAMSGVMAKDGSAQVPKFLPMPQRQNVVRTPPINWDKYHVVGESLDRMHEEQRKHPSSKWTKNAPKAPEYVIAAPWTIADKDSTGMPRKDSKRPG